jgi:hypothetical protein
MFLSDIIAAIIEKNDSYSYRKRINFSLTPAHLVPSLYGHEVETPPGSEANPAFKSFKSFKSPLPDPFAGFAG